MNLILLGVAITCIGGRWCAVLYCTVLYCTVLYSTVLTCFFKYLFGTVILSTDLSFFNHVLLLFFFNFFCYSFVSYWCFRVWLVLVCVLMMHYKLRQDHFALEKDKVIYLIYHLSYLLNHLIFLTCHLIFLIYHVICLTCHLIFLISHLIWLT